MDDLRAAINNPLLSGEERLTALGKWYSQNATGNAATNKAAGEINNHIHTIYSFSPYTPAMAALRAREAGLVAAGSVDHDSEAAASEMIAACAILGLGGCCGFELRVDFTHGPNGAFFTDKKLNNPDSSGFAYITIQ